jgi:ribosome-associated toxin RatA of RatAB toxin-antitoxin module
MSTSHLQFTARIEGSPETIFDLIADMPNYGRWLPGSEAFGGTTEVSPYAVRRRESLGVQEDAVT